MRTPPTRLLFVASISIVLTLSQPFVVGSLAREITTQQLKFSVRSNAMTYHMTENMFFDGAVKFKANLQNISKKSTTVCAYPVGVVGIRRLERDGQIIMPTRRGVSFDEDPR